MGDFGGCSYPVAETVSEEERSWAMAAHIGTMLGSAVPFGNVLVPLVIWLTQKEKSSFVDKHARESMAFQIGVMVAAFALVMLAIVTLGAGIIIAVPAFFLLLGANLVYMILATVRANEGKIWEYPVTTRFVP
jgi:uncharacterized Tic20 family protein